MVARYIQVFSRWPAASWIAGQLLQKTRMEAGKGGRCGSKGAISTTEIRLPRRPIGGDSRLPIRRQPGPWPRRSSSHRRNHYTLHRFWIKNRCPKKGSGIHLGFDRLSRRLCSGRIQPHFLMKIPSSYAIPEGIRLIESYERTQRNFRKGNWRGFERKCWGFFLRALTEVIEKTNADGFTTLFLSLLFGDGLGFSATVMWNSHLYRTLTMVCLGVYLTVHGELLWPKNWSWHC